MPRSVIVITGKGSGMPLQHISKEFDKELETIRTNVLELGGLVEGMIKSAVQGLEESDVPLLKDVLHREKQVNQMELDIDDRCNHVIARRQPTAADLRFVLTCMKMIRDLERIGDEAEKIARMALMIHESSSGSFTPRVELSSMYSLVLKMMRQSLDAFARNDSSTLPEVIREDISVDDHFRNTLRLLISYMIEDTRTISRSIDLLFIAKALERIGDHSKNMSEHVVYMVKGRDVRHLDVEDVERQVKAD
jgi:phosphate transport system protein